ncbi:MAG: hypothetical protein KKH83_08965 [Candidatus Margulisbacteria bacterium]|nr:hypothetical protein [Candidatus Margulisiibacteriota bacterium]
MSNQKISGSVTTLPRNKVEPKRTEKKIRLATADTATSKGVQEDFKNAAGKAPKASVNCNGRYWYTFNGIKAEGKNDKVHITGNSKYGGFGVNTEKGKNGEMFDSTGCSKISFDIGGKARGQKITAAFVMENGAIAETAEVAVKGGKIEIELPPAAKGKISKLEFKFGIAAVDLELDNIAFAGEQSQADKAVLAERGQASDPIMTINKQNIAPKTAGKYHNNLLKLQSYFLSKPGDPPAATKAFQTKDGQAIAAYHIYEDKPTHLDNGGATTSEGQVLFFNFMTLAGAATGKKEGMTGALNYLRYFMMPGDGFENDKLKNYQGPNLVHWMIDVAGKGDGEGVFGENTLYNKYDPGYGNKPYACIAGQKGKGGQDAGKNGKAALFNSAPDADQWMIEGLYFATLFGLSDENDLISSMRGSLTRPLSDETEMPNVMHFGYYWGETKEGSAFEGVNRDLYTGYQTPAAWQIMGRPGIAKKIVSFLDKSQKAYQETHSVSGPFMPVYHDGKFGWDGLDPNTHWGGFQYRTFAHLAFYYYLTGDADAKRVLNNFAIWVKRNMKVADGKITELPLELENGKKASGKAVGSVIKTGFDPHAFGLFAQGLTYIEASGIKTNVEMVLDTLVAKQAANGSFPYADQDPANSGTYGFHNSEVGIALGLYEMLLNK